MEQVHTSEIKAMFSFMHRLSDFLVRTLGYFLQYVCSLEVFQMVFTLTVIGAVSQSYLKNFEKKNWFYPLIKYLYGIVSVFFVVFMAIDSSGPISSFVLEIVGAINKLFQIGLVTIALFIGILLANPKTKIRQYKKKIKDYNLIINKEKTGKQVLEIMVACIFIFLLYHMVHKILLHAFFIVLEMVAFVVLKRNGLVSSFVLGTMLGTRIIFVWLSTVYVYAASFNQLSYQEIQNAEILFQLLVFIFYFYLIVGENLLANINLYPRGSVLHYQFCLIAFQKLAFFYTFSYLTRVWFLLSLSFFFAVAISCHIKHLQFRKGEEQISYSQKSQKQLLKDQDKVFKAYTSFLGCQQAMIFITMITFMLSEIDSHLKLEICSLNDGLIPQFFEILRVMCHLLILLIRSVSCYILFYWFQAVVIHFWRSQQEKEEEWQKITNMKKKLNSLRDGFPRIIIGAIFVFLTAYEIWNCTH